MRKTLLSAMLGMLGMSAAAHAESADKKLTPQERIERNYALARRAHDAYANMAKTGRADSFRAEDYAPGWKDVYFSPDATNKHRLMEKVTENRKDFADWDIEEYGGVIAAIPDLSSTKPFTAICNAEGCSYQINLGGHDKHGKYHEFNEAMYFWTNEYGKVYRVEGFDDWVNITEFLGFIAGKQFCDFADIDLVAAGYKKYRQEAAKEK